MFLILEPNQGAAPFVLGTARNKVRTLLKGYRLITLGVEPENDKYPDEGLILGYDADDKLEYIEITRPSAATYLDIHFIGADVNQIVSRLAQLGATSQDRAGSYTVSPFNFALYAPSGCVLSVSLYREGYY